MKRQTLKSIAGVTLLEIMLVLAIAAMIIVMSVKYYQSASTSQLANSALQSIQSITASADSIAQSTGSYSNAKASAITSIAGASAMNLPWGGVITIAPSAATYTITMPNMPAAVCNSLTFKLKSNSHYSALTTCTTAAASFSYTYNP